MRNLRGLFGRGGVVGLGALAVMLTFSASVTAEDEPAALKQAIHLYKVGEYLAAQEKLAAIDRSKLNAEQQALRDEYLNRVQVAITMYEKALRDLEDAETAIAEEELDQAERLLESVLANEYAAEPLVRAARAHLRDLRAPKPEPVTPPPERRAPTPPPTPAREEKPSPPPAERKEPTPPPKQREEPTPKPAEKEQPSPPPPEREEPSPPPAPAEEVKKPTPPPEQPEPAKEAEEEEKPIPPPVEAAEEKAVEEKPPEEKAVEEKPAGPPSEVSKEQPAGAISAVTAQRARVLTEEANELRRAARYEEARRRYQEALVAVPGYPEAVEGLRQLQEHERTLRGTRGESLIERIRRESRINWQRALTEYRDLEQQIRDHVAADRFDEASQLLIRARQVVEASKQFADPVAQYEDLFDEMVALEQGVRTQERAYNERQVAEIARQIEQQRKRRLQEIEKRRARQVEALMSQAEQHRKDGDLDAAINVLQQVVMIDPKYRPARWRMDDLEDLRQYREGRKTRDTFYSQTRRSLEDVEKAKIPWADQLRYPKDWPELITRPDRQRPEARRRSSRLLGALDTQIPVDFRHEPFEDVIERLAGDHHLNIIVNWNDLKRAGIDRSTPIDLSLPQDITLKKALAEMLDQLGGGDDVGYEVADGAIKIATRDTLDKKTYTAVYDINDLLFEVPMFTDSPSTDLADTTQPQRPPWAQQQDQPWRYGDDDDDEPEEDSQRAGRIRQLIDLIQDSVAKNSWYDRGGSIGRINEFNGQLVITQNSAAQAKISNLLSQLRAQRAVQIAIEARFITVTSNYLEEMGIDIDFVLNSGNAGLDFVPSGQGPLRDPVLGSTLLLPRTFSRLGFTPNAPALGSGLVTTPTGGLAQPFGRPELVPQTRGGGGRRLTPVPIINQISSFTDPAALGSDIPGSFAGSTIGSAFSLFGSFLDNIQVDFLIRATQADSRSTVLTAPRLVLFNGQRSFVAVTIQQNFVSQLNPQVGAGAVAQAPVTNTINAGAVMDVEATVTADKRYVTMTIRPSVTRLIALQTLPFSGGAAGAGVGGGPALAAFVQLPTLSTQAIQTTVSVPDGGTLLIGGQKLASETEVEAGVPILSKIPILKRLYSSRTLVKDEQTLLVLVKPRILIQTEQEEVAFPSFRTGG